MKRKLSIILCTIILNLVLAGNVFAIDIGASGYKNHTGWSPDWGTKAYNIATYYRGNQYEQSGNQYVDGHDYIVSLNTTYSWEIPPGEAQLQNVQLLNTSGTALSSLNNGNFSDGLYRSYFFDPTDEFLAQRVSYSWLQSTAGTYRAKVSTIYMNPEFTGMSGTDIYYSPYF